MSSYTLTHGCICMTSHLCPPIAQRIYFLALAVQLQRQESALAGAAMGDDTGAAAAMADDSAEEEGEEDELTYEQMLEIGEQIGDVKKDQWKKRASDYVDALPQRCYVVPSTPEANARSSISASYVCSAEGKSYMN